jgi:hypothetical protein
VRRSSRSGTAVILLTLALRSRVWKRWALASGGVRVVVSLTRDDRSVGRRLDHLAPSDFNPSRATIVVGDPSLPAAFAFPRRPGVNPDCDAVA